MGAEPPCGEDVGVTDRIETALREEGATWREKVFTPVLTLWAFLTPVLDPAKGCRAGVARVMAWLDAQGLLPCGPATGGYGKARGRLPEALLARRDAGDRSDPARRCPDRWRWRGRRVQVADGTGLSMPDTPGNRAAYPILGSQKPGVGFPQARLVALFSLVTGRSTWACQTSWRSQRCGCGWGSGGSGRGPWWWSRC
jgi:hypothetical protein